MADENAKPPQFVLGADDPFAAALLRDLACRRAAAGDDDGAAAARRAAESIDAWDARP